jgi:hypothetical protein
MTERTLTTSGVMLATGAEKSVKLPASPVVSIPAFLKKMMRDGVKEFSAIVSVNQALIIIINNVIIKELTQMYVLKKWEALHSEGLLQTARSSMFLKRKTHPDG